MANQDRWPELCRLVEHDDGLPTRDCGSWTEDKLWIWNRYVSITTTAMVGSPNWPAGLAYVDLFAGPGICRLRDSGRRLPGSALIAAHTRKPFSRILCSELNPALAYACKSRLEASPARDVAEVICGDCNQVADQIADKIPNGALTLCFVDPPGFDIQFDTLKRLSHGRKMDFLLLFADAIDLVRNVEHYLREEGSKLDRFFGAGVNWRSHLNKLDDLGSGKLSDSVRSIFEQQMRSQLGYAGFDYKSIRSPQGKLYDLVYASKHERGLDFWRKVNLRDRGGQGELFGVN